MISPSGIAPGGGIGTPSFTGYINPSGIAPSGGIGTPVLLPDTERKFVVFIGGVDRTEFCSAAKGQGISITDMLGGRASAQFIVHDPTTDAFVPSVGQEVIIHHNVSGERLFGGEIQSVADELLPGPRGFHTYGVSCTGYGVICDRRAIAKWYTLAMGSYAQIVAYDIHANFLGGTGITYSYPQGTGTIFDEQLFNWITVSQALDQICAAGGLEWVVDKHKGNWRRLVATTDRGKFANRVIVRNSQDPGAIWTDETTADGSLIYSTTYPQVVKPVVTLTSGSPATEVEQVVCEMSERGVTPGWQWYYIAGGVGIFPNPASAPSSGTLKVMYPSKTSYVAIAQDDDSIAAVGYYDHIEEVKDLPTLEAMQAHAERVLAQRMQNTTHLEIETDKAGLEPGQLLAVDANDVSGDFLIEQINIQEIGNTFPRWTVQASDASLRTGSSAAMWNRALRLQRQPIDRVDSGVVFYLAETIEGIDNPGLTAGVKRPPRVCRKDGYLKAVRLYFNSSSSPATLTTSDIEIDVLYNGVSIFPSGTYMVYPAGATTVAYQFWFASNPFQVSAGGIFTVEIISADSAATDGFLEVQVQG
jgi:hypothetical protein